MSTEKVNQPVVSGILHVQLGHFCQQQLIDDGPVYHAFSVQICRAKLIHVAWQNLSPELRTKFPYASKFPCDTVKIGRNSQEASMPKTSSVPLPFSTSLYTRRVRSGATCAAVNWRCTPADTLISPTTSSRQLDASRTRQVGRWLLRAAASSGVTPQSSAQRRHRVADPRRRRPRFAIAGNRTRYDDNIKRLLCLQ